MNSPIMPRDTAGQQNQSPSPTNPQQQQFADQPQVRRLSPEEMRAFRECNRESFFYRSLPLAVVGLVGVRVMVQRGYWKAHQIWGNYPKYVFAGMLGYFVGKLSYLNKCREKLMQLPNSELAEALRKSYGGGKRQFEVLHEMVQLPEISGSGGGGGSGGDEHGYSPIREGSDIYTNPDFSVGGGQNAQQAADQAGQKSSTSYDDLRRRNREEYLRQQFGVQPSTGQQPQQQNQQQAQSYMQPSQHPQSSSTQDHQPQKPRFSYGDPPEKSTTRYGDTDFK